MTDLMALSPCPVPWCQSDVLELIRSPFSRGYGVVCQNCRAQGPSLTTKADAIAAWNRRNELPALIEREKALRTFVTSLANNPHKTATWLQTRQAAASLLAALAGQP